MTRTSDSWQTPTDLFNVLDKGGVYQNIEFKGFNFDIDLCASKDNTKVNFFCDDYLNWPIEQLVKAGESKPVQSAFMNPPYSNPKPFIEKAWEDSRYCKIVCLVKCDPSTKWWSTFWEYSKHIKCSGPDICQEYYCTDAVCNGGKVTVYLPDGEGTRKELVCNTCEGRGYTGSYNGPKPGCDYIFFHKRIKFDPPQELIDSGEVWRIKNKWVQKCKWGFYNRGACTCKGKGYKELSGPTFSSALIIMDRRGL